MALASQSAAEEGEEEVHHPQEQEGGGDAVNDFEVEYAKLPPMGWEEKVILCDFVSIALLWFFRDPKGR